MAISSLVAHYELSEDDCRREVSDADIAKIASSLHGKWKSQLPSLLGLDPIVVDDILGAPGNIPEEDRRLAFFRKWKQQKDFEATYEVLISALLEINCKQDAGTVCKILKETVSAAPSRQAFTSTNVPGSSGMAPQTSTSLAASVTRTVTLPEDSQPKGHHPTIIVHEKDINFLIENFLHDYSYMWIDIAATLGFRYSEIKAIDSNIGGDVNRGLRELLMRWSQWPIVDHEVEPTLEKLRDALCSRVVGLGSVGRHLYERRNELPSLKQ